MQDEQTRPRPTGASGQIALPPEIMDKLWYAHIADKTYGPYSGHEIQRMAETGRIVASDLLCPEGGSAWIEAGNEPALGALFAAGAPIAARPVPPATAPAPQAQRLELPSNLTAGSRSIPQAPSGASKSSRRGSRAMFERPDQDRIRDDLREYFGPHADAYLDIYEKMRARKTPFASTRNWVVLITGFPWYFYRKMYITGTLLIFVPALINYLFGLTGNIGVAAGLYVTANSQYVLSGIRRIEKADTLGLIGNERRDYLRRAGGVSVVAGTLAGLLCAAVFILAIVGGFHEAHKAGH